MNIHHQWNNGLQGKIKALGGTKNSVPVPLCAPQIPCGLSWDV
jgi:hypothetical protein